MYSFEFEDLIQNAALGEAKAWGRLTGYLRQAMEEVVCGMLNPPTEASVAGITKELLQVAQGELQRLGNKIRAEANMKAALSRALGFPKKPLLVAFERWLLHLAIRHCHVHYHPWLHDWALKQLHRFRSTVPPAELMQEAMRECLVRLGFEQRAVLVLYHVDSVLAAHNVTFRDVAVILGWGENDQAASRAQKRGKRGQKRIKQIWIRYECTETGGGAML